VADYITDGDVWREHYLPGLPRGLGRAWVLVLGLPLGAAAMSLLRRRPVLERLVGGMVLAGAAAYLFTPLTADGGGLAFVYNLRYLTPVLLVGFVAGAVRLESAPLPWRRAALALLAVIVVANASARHHERMPAWPVGHLGAALLACVVVLMVVGLAVSAGRRGSGALRALVTIAVVVAIAGGWVLQRHYFAHRYVDAGLPLDDVYAELADLQGERVGTAGFLDLYPLFGSDLSNRASRIGDPSVGSPVDRCRRWREALNAERYGYVVVSQETFVVSSLPQEWLADDPAASEIFRRGGTAVYRIDGALDPQGCAATG
jgi:hypothetical protein